MPYVFVGLAKIAYNPDVGREWLRPKKNAKQMHLTKTGPILIFFVWMVYPLALEALSIRLNGLPMTNGEQGTAFVKAWLTFRSDLDGMAHSGTHPKLLDEWFKAMPPFMVRDAARLATEPEVVLAAAARLAELGGRANQQLIAALQAEQKNDEIGRQLKAFRVKAGDIRQKQKTTMALKSALPHERILAAITLLQAGEEKGVVFLTRWLQKGDEGRDMAARALGLFGRDEDALFLERLVDNDPNNTALAAAHGALLTKRYFPFHHRMILGRDPSHQLLTLRDGLYENWFAVIGRVIQAGAYTSTALAAALEKLRRSLKGDGINEVQRRRLTSLMDYWDAVDRQIEQTAPYPSWPTDFKAAMEVISQDAKRGKDTPEIFAARMAAEIAVITILGKRIGHKHLAMPTLGLRVLTPGGGRAIDGNMATAWHLASQSTLTLKLEKGGKIDALWLMNSCPDESGSKTIALKISGLNRDKSWTYETGLEKKTHYYQRVPLAGRQAHKLLVTFQEIDSNQPLCIAEVRVTFR